MADFMEFFDRVYFPQLGIRAPSFRAVMREAMARDIKVVVETGCARQKDNWVGDGQSTLIWGAYTKFVRGSSTSIDIDPEAIKIARESILEKQFYVTFVEGDSVKELAKLTNTVDLLYLDSYDVDMAAPETAAMHCLFEFCSAKPFLKSGSIVFIDDSPIIGPEFSVGGKGKYVAEYFKQLGIHPFTVGYQIAWIMP